jgi:hypothetical protein
MAITINLKFNPVAPVAGQGFSKLLVELTDAGGTVRKVEFTQAQIQAAATDNGDGSYTLPVTFTTVGAGAYTVKAQALNVALQGYGPIATAEGVVSLTDGVWIPAPVEFV